MEIKLSQIAVNQQNNFSKQILIMVRNHTIKATKCSLCLNIKMTQIQLQNNMLSVKDHLKHHEDQHTHVCKEAQVIDPKDVYNTFVH